MDALFVPQRRVVFPPRRKSDKWCIACFSQDGSLKQFHVDDSQFSLHHELHAAVQMVGACRSLCKHCRERIAAGWDTELRQTIGLEIMASSLDPRNLASAFLESELGITFALWWLRGVPLGALTAGLNTWCALLDAYPQELNTQSTAERNLGNGVYATFSTFWGGLWIDNLVSRQRRRGFGMGALREICAIADEHGAAIYGKVEPNSPPKIAGAVTHERAPLDVLLRSYAAEGFKPLPFVGSIIVQRWPR